VLFSMVMLNRKRGSFSLDRQSVSLSLSDLISSSLLSIYLSLSLLA